MIGVVLWTDPRQAEAVIWCEDHGDLALYRGNEAACCAGLFFDVGDLVKFDVETQRSLRFATNPEVLEQGYYPDLPQMMTSQVSKDQDRRQPGRPSADIIPLFQNIVPACTPVPEKTAKTG